MDSNAERRVYQYFNIDGLLELVAGTLLLLIALTSGINQLFPSVSSAIVFIPVFVAIPLLMRGVLVLKRRLTYPRTGYAVPRYRYPRYFVFILFAVLLLVTIVQGFFLPSWAQGLPLLLGTLTAGLLWWLSTGLVRFYYLAAAALALGIGLAWLPFEPLVSGAIFCTIVGLLLLVSGGFTLRHYLQKNQER